MGLSFWRVYVWEELMIEGNFCDYICQVRSMHSAVKLVYANR